MLDRVADRLERRLGVLGALARGVHQLAEEDCRAGGRGWVGLGESVREQELRARAASGQRARARAVPAADPARTVDLLRGDAQVLVRVLAEGVLEVLADDCAARRSRRRERAGSGRRAAGGGRRAAGGGRELGRALAAALALARGTGPEAHTHPRRCTRSRSGSAAGEGARGCGSGRLRWRSGAHARPRRVRGAPGPANRRANRMGRAPGTRLGRHRGGRRAAGAAREVRPGARWRAAGGVRLAVGGRAEMPEKASRALDPAGSRHLTAEGLPHNMGMESSPPCSTHRADGKTPLGRDPAAAAACFATRPARGPTIDRAKVPPASRRDLCVRGDSRVTRAFGNPRLDARPPGRTARPTQTRTRSRPTPGAANAAAAAAAASSATAFDLCHARATDDVRDHAPGPPLRRSLRWCVRRRTAAGPPRLRSSARRPPDRVALDRRRRPPPPPQRTTAPTAPTRPAPRRSASSRSTPTPRSRT